jgi:type II pantothenate kinase
VCTGKEKCKFHKVWMLPGTDVNMSIKTALQSAGYDISDFDQIAVTGGRYRELQKDVAGTPIIKVSEIEAIGRGGLLLTRLDTALVISAGTGTAMVSASMDGSRHVTGSAVGGGTLQGLGKLLLGTSDAVRINRWAARGDANQVDLTLKEAIGGTIGLLPAEANAVNFGKPPDLLTIASQQDIAAGLVRMVAQVIAVIAINAADAAGMEHIVFTGHLIDLSQVRLELKNTAGFYDQQFILPENPGSGTVKGTLSWAFHQIEV